MARRKQKRHRFRLTRLLKGSIKKHKRSSNRTNRSGFTVKLNHIGSARLERGLRVLAETHDLTAAALAIRVSPEQLKQAARRRRAIRKQGKRWAITSHLPRRMPIFTDGRQLAISVRSRSASLIGRYMSAVGEFLRKNDPSRLTEFVKRSVRDTRGRSYVFETNPNALYRLSSAGGDLFEDVYRVIL